MPKPSHFAKEVIVAAAEAVYAILSENNIKACAIGSMAIVYTTDKPFGRDPNVIRRVLALFITLTNYSIDSR